MEILWCVFSRQVGQFFTILLNIDIAHVRVRGLKLIPAKGALIVAEKFGPPLYPAACQIALVLVDAQGLEVYRWTLLSEVHAVVIFLHCQPAKGGFVRARHRTVRLLEGHHHRRVIVLTFYLLQVARRVRPLMFSLRSRLFNVLYHPKLLDQ